MRKILCGVLVASATLATSVLAQDAEGGSRWNGPYVGATLGYSFGNGQTTTTTGTTAFLGLGPLITPRSLTNNARGIIGGGTVGYNIQNDTLVYGVEADLSYFNKTRRSSFSGAPITGLAPLGLTTSASQKLRWLGTARGRVGFAANEQLLVFATGGLAFGGVSTTAGVVANGAPAVAWAGSTSKTKVGWTLGAGAEFAVNENVSLKGEYLYYKLGSVTTNATGNATVRGIAALNGIDYLSRTKTQGSVVRVGVNFKF
jgi:outer membrane immunogenic protein